MTAIIAGPDGSVPFAGKPAGRSHPPRPVRCPSCRNTDPMPHLVTHRPRLHNLASDDETSPSHKQWETVSAFSYEIGGVTFVVGSVCFLPSMSDYFALGGWLFLVGSILYLMVTGHEFFEVLKYWRRHPTETFANRIEYIAASCYALGSLLFTVGSVCFLPSVDATVLGVWLFIVGSVLFLVGGFINILQVVEAPSLIYMQLFNFTIAQFIVGSGLFLVATIPYLWHLGHAAQTQVDTFAAAQFIFASVMFLAGGMAIYYRKLVGGKLEAYCRESGMSTMFIHALRSEIQDKSHFVLKGKKHKD